jgi:predicted HTH transcriptional regulator
MDKITSRPIQCFKKGDAFVEMAPRPLVFVEVNEVKDSQSYTNENGGKTGGKVGGENEGNVPVIELTERQRVILELISIDSTLSAKALSEKMSEKMSEKSSVNERTIERDIAKLKKLDYLRRIGGRKDGHWEVNIPLNSIVEIV